MVSPQSKRIPVSWTFPFKGLEGPDNIEIVYQKLKNIKWISHMLWNKKSNVNLSVAVLLCWRPCWYPHEKVTNKLITLYKTLIYKNIGIDNPVKIVFFFFFKLWKRIPLQYTATGQLSVQVDATGHAEQLFIRVKISRESVCCYLNQSIKKNKSKQNKTTTQNPKGIILQKE